MYRIYATSTCAVCKVAAKYLEERDIPYEYKLIDKDIEAKNELFEHEPNVRLVPWIFKVNFVDGLEIMKPIGSFQSLKEYLEGQFVST